ncbi:hypothetical protein E2562_004148 [Oryza meyeriana var. granulata]|uniref:Glycosyltransferase n=1 Tax=Oryza meyeriana var. granulata TaxID=110450 RepID=A0A6G1EV64_9ORYZ|nr:hypothetical protein E2562_004148 [Oryza meyeriana var. granulata]
MAAAADDAAPRAHALILPYPAQGHVIPLMELAHCLVDRGFAVTFVNTEHNHRRVVAASAGGGVQAPGSRTRLRLAGVADGMGDGEDRDNLVRLNAAMQDAIPPQLEPILDGDDGAGGEGLGKVTCVVVDVGMSWALDAVKRRGLPAAALWAASAAVLAVLLGAKKLIHDGVIDDDGAPLKLENNSFHLTESTPPMDATFLAWNFMGNHDAERMVFHYLTSMAQAAAVNANILLCNTFAELEPSIFSGESLATILPIGPLRTGQRYTSPEAVVGHFWQTNNDTCLTFLDEQPPGSVVYVSFGSLTVMSPEQLQELALGLEASGHPFLWVVRPGLTSKLPTSFMDPMVGQGKGRVVGWAPQEQVLAHPAVGCFVTHCGWNSTLEGIRNGVPMLCWPYFTDQFTNQTYICDIWQIGLKMVQTFGGEIVTKDIIIERLEELLLDEGAKERVKRLKELAEMNINGKGESMRNFNAFLEFIVRPVS